MKILISRSSFLISRFLACIFIRGNTLKNGELKQNPQKTSSFIFDAVTQFLKISTLVLLIFGTKNSFAQIQEPSSFDWKESVEVNRKIESFYDSDVIENMPTNARFWVDIKPFSSKVKKTTYAEEGIATYQSIEKIESFYNGESFNHGLHKSIKFEGETYYSLISSPDDYKVKKKFHYEENIVEVTLPYTPEFDLSHTLNSFENNDDWGSYVQEDALWFYSEDSNVDFSFDVNSNSVATYDPVLDIYENITYAEVYPDLWQPILKVTIYTEETLEGICLSRKETTEYENYEYEITNDGETAGRRSNPSLGINKIIQNGTTITFNSSFDSEYSVIIYDVSGRILNSLSGIKNEFNFNPPYTGIYFISFNDGSSSYSSKVFLTN